MRQSLKSLTGLRFLAAALIVCHHTERWFATSKFITQHVQADYGVTFFYVLSGFILYYVHNGIETKQQRTEFIVARIARIWPIHMVTMILVIVVFPMAGISFTVTKFVAQFFMLHSWFPSPFYFFGFNGPSWSLSVELFFYLMFPLAIVKWKQTWALKICFAVAFSAFIVIVADNINTPKNGFDIWLSMAFPIVRLPEFLVGIAFAHAWLAKRDAIAICDVGMWTILEIVSLAAAYGALAWFPTLVSSIPLGPITKSLMTRSAPAPIFALLIFCVASGRGYASRMIGCKPMVFLGEISFSLYMIHEVIIRAILRYYPNLLFKESVWVGPAIYWTSSLLASIALWALVEKPARLMIVGAYRSRNKPKVGVACV